MKKNQKPQNKIQWKFRSSPLALKILLVLLILFCTVTVTALYWIHLQISSYTDDLRQDVAAIEYANAELEEKNASPDSAQNITDIAREELGLVDPNTILVNPG